MPPPDKLAMTRRGIGISNHSSATCKDAIRLGATWYYTWDPYGITNCPGVEHVPMLSRNAVLNGTALWSSSRYIMGQNEPDRHIAPSQMLSVWNTMETKYPNHNLVAPAPSHEYTAHFAINPGGEPRTNRFDWISSFYTEYQQRYNRKPRIHALAAHCYGAANEQGLAFCKSIVNEYVEKAKKWHIPGGVWVTEFNFLPVDHSQVDLSCDSETLLPEERDVMIDGKTKLQHWKDDYQLNHFIGELQCTDRIVDQCGVDDPHCVCDETQSYNQLTKNGERFLVPYCTYWPIAGQDAPQCERITFQTATPLCRVQGSCERLARCSRHENSQSKSEREYYMKKFLQFLEDQPIVTRYAGFTARSRGTEKFANHIHSPAGMLECDETNILADKCITPQFTPVGKAYQAAHCAVFSGSAGNKGARWTRHIATTVHTTPKFADLRLHDWNADGRPDLMYVKKQGTQSGKIEIHIADGRDNFQSYAFHGEISVTAHSRANYNAGVRRAYGFADRNNDRRPDLYVLDDVPKENQSFSPVLRIYSGMKHGNTAPFRRKLLQVAPKVPNYVWNTVKDQHLLVADMNADGVDDVILSTRLEKTPTTDRFHIVILDGSRNFSHRLFQGDLPGAFYSRNGYDVALSANKSNQRPKIVLWESRRNNEGTVLSPNVLVYGLNNDDTAHGGQLYVSEDLRTPFEAARTTPNNTTTDYHHARIANVTWNNNNNRELALILSDQTESNRTEIHILE